MQFSQTLFVCFALVIGFHAMADDHSTMEKSGTVVKMPLAEKANLHAQDLPKRGASKESVQKQYGMPNKKHPAKGQPPIERWDYDNFSVYFEKHSVIHSVDKRKNE